MENSKPSLSCEKVDIYTINEFEYGNGALTQPIGLISADEAMFAGVPWWENGMSSDNYLYTGKVYWTMSPSNLTGGGANVFYVSDGCNIIDHFPTSWDESGVRPVINLRSDVVLSGSGTSTDPFTVVGA